MAAFYPVLFAAPGRRVVCGSFAPNGSSAIVAATVRPKTARGFTVAYTSTGLYTVTFDRKYCAMDACFVQFHMNAATDVKPQVAADYVIATNTLVIRSLAIAALTDIAANANNKIDFMAVMVEQSGLA